jgi:WD40 repeat protein
MSAERGNDAHPPELTGKRRKPLNSRQRLLAVLLLLLALAPVSIVAGYKLLHPPRTQAVAFSPDGHLLAAGSTGDRIRIWNVQSGTLLHTLTSETMKDVWALAFSPDGRVLASGSEGIVARTSSSAGVLYEAVTFWDVKSGRKLSTSLADLLVGLALAFSPDGRTLAVAALDGIALLRSGDGSNQHFFPFDYAMSVAFSPDGKVLAAGTDGGYDPAHHLHPSSIALWDVASGKHLLTIPHQSGAISSLAFSPDGHLLATASAEKAVAVWSVATGTLFRAFEGHSGAVTAVAFSPDGRMLAAGSADQTIQLWEVRNGTLVRTLNGHTTAIASIAFSPDGRTLASGSSDVTLALWADQTVKLWNVNTGSLLRTLSG